MAFGFPIHFFSITKFTDPGLSRYISKNLCR